MIYWPPEIKEKLHAILADTPAGYRKYADLNVVAAAEEESRRAGRTEMDEEHLIRGFIRSIPRHLRDGIHDILSEHNVDMIYFRPVFDEPLYLPKNDRSNHQSARPTKT